FYPYGIGAFVAATLVVATAAGVHRSPDAPLAIAIGALALGMSLRSRRFLPIFGMGGTLVVALALPRLGASLRYRVPPLVPALGALALAAVWLAPYPKTSSAFHHLTADYEFPVETLDFACSGEGEKAANVRVGAFCKLFAEKGPFVAPIFSSRLSSS